MAYEPLLREHLVLVSPPGTRLPGRVGVQALKDYPMVLPASPNPIRQLVDAVLLPRKITLNIVAEVGAVHSALSLVERGMARSILPEGTITAPHTGAGVLQASIGPRDVDPAGPRGAGSAAAEPADSARRPNPARVGFSAGRCLITLHLPHRTARSIRVPADDIFLASQRTSVRDTTNGSFRCCKAATG